LIEGRVAAAYLHLYLALKTCSRHLCLLCRRRFAESKLSDAELQIEALESKLTSLSQLLETEQAAAESALKASEQSWQTQLIESTSSAASDAKAAAEEEARTVQSDLQRQLAESNATYEVRQTGMIV